MENHEEEHPNKVAGPRKGFITAFVILLIACIAFLVATVVYMSLYYSQGQNTPTTNKSMPNIPPPPINSLEGEYVKGAVAADNVMCSEIGRNVLLRGGNAVEAAIAALFCIGIMDTHSAGMGGGHIMTIYNATEKRCHVVDARHAAPLLANATMFGNNATPSEYGWRSVSVPGEIAGLWKEYTHFKSGKVTWKSLVQPTVDLLADGYPVTHALQAALDQYHDYLWDQPTMRWAFNPNSTNGNQTWKVGELITTRQAFKNFTQLIADAENGTIYGSNPHQVFYNSNWTQKMADEFAANGGIITLKDFQIYEAKLRSQDQVIYSYHKNGRIICGAPPPASSAVVQSILGILDGFDYPQNATFDQVVENLHRFIEASKFAFAARLNLGDIDFVNNSLSISKEIVTAAWTSAMRAKITNTTHDDSYYNGTQNFYMHDIRGTTHISVLDAEGNAASVTSTINLFFGAKVTSDSTGVLWNDEMNDFSLPGLSDYFGFVPSPANYIEPKKRPMSATSPIVIFNEYGNVEDVNEISIFGAAGGSTIISATAGIAWHNLWLNDSVKAAMDFPRLHNQYRPNNTNYEDRLPEEYANALRARGHNMTSTDEIATATAINKPASKSPNYSSRYSIFANSDFRKGVESGPAGY
uniref:Gamma-glutamyltransferase n=1 Tax=Acrobeloides nanus TaxID=290746 RepID=A0A914DD72_9BILA